MTFPRPSRSTHELSDPLDVSGVVVLDVSVIDELHSFGEGFVADLIDGFATETGLLLLELREAFMLDDSPTVARITHSIKGSCGQLGGHRLARACNRLELRATVGCLSQGEPDLEDIEREHNDLSRSLTAVAARV